LSRPGRSVWTSGSSRPPPRRFRATAHWRTGRRACARSSGSGRWRVRLCRARGRGGSHRFGLRARHEVGSSLASRARPAIRASNVSPVSTRNCLVTSPTHSGAGSRQLGLPPRLALPQIGRYGANAL
jgi:hypothetical protein